MKIEVFGDAHSWGRFRDLLTHGRPTGKNPFQLGGSFVFGPGDVDRYAHFSETFGDNADMRELLAAIA